MIGHKIALIPRYSTATLEASGIDFNVDSDQAWFDIPFKCNVLYAGVTVTTVIAADDAVVKFDRQNAAGSATGRTDATIADIVVPNATAVGTMVYDKVAQDSMTKAAAALLTTEANCQAGGGYWDSDASLCKNHVYGELQPGNQIVVQVSASSATGNAVPILVVEVSSEVFANLDNVLETA